MIENLQTSTSTSQQNLLSSLTYRNNNKNTEKYKKYRNKVENCKTINFYFFSENGNY